jgi:hypothetical protein
MSGFLFYGAGYVVQHASRSRRRRRGADAARAKALQLAAQCVDSFNAAD